MDHETRCSTRMYEYAPRKRQEEQRLPCARKCGPHLEHWYQENRQKRNNLGEVPGSVTVTWPVILRNEQDLPANDGRQPRSQGMQPPSPPSQPNAIEREKENRAENEQASRGAHQLKAKALRERCRRPRARVGKVTLKEMMPHTQVIAEE